MILLLTCILKTNKNLMCVWLILNEIKELLLLVSRSLLFLMAA